MQSDIIATGSSGGDLTLNAGVDINISANITTANGNLSLEANNESISGRGNNRYSDIDISSTVNLGTGDLNITLGNSNTTGSYDINLSSATINANNITITDSATNNSHPSDLGNFTTSSAINVTSANKYLNVNGATLTANGTGTAVDITSKYLGGSGSVSTLMEFGEQLIQKPQHLEDFWRIYWQLYPIWLFLWRCNSRYRQWTAKCL